jgi:ureidoacrylate peracid hydrolase
VHEILIAPDVLQAVAARDPRKRILESLDPRHTAHIVVDLQHGFLAPGAAVEVEFAREIVSTVNDVSRAIRAAGGVNVFLRMNMATDAQRPGEVSPTTSGTRSRPNGFAPPSVQAAKASSSGAT